MSEDTPEWGPPILKVKVGKLELAPEDIKALLKPQWPDASDWQSQLKRIAAAFKLGPVEFVVATTAAEIRRVERRRKAARDRKLQALRKASAALLKRTKRRAK